MSNTKHTILVVDDEAKIIDVVKSFLESKGFVVFSAENGKDALQIIESKAISLILLDLMLPDMSGEDICMTIRKKSRVPIIMLTAKADEANMLEGLSIGADDYMTKPFSLKELYARIDAVLRRSQNDLQPLYNRGSFGNGDLVVDFETHTVRKQKQEVNLTPNEYNLFLTFVKYPHKVFTREELIRVAFSNDFDGYDRAVDSHIKNLRQKIENDPKNPIYILTIHGIGYKFGGV